MQFSGISRYKLTFFMSLFWWKRFPVGKNYLLMSDSRGCKSLCDLPQNWQGYGRVSLWINRCVERVLDLLNALPHCLHSKTFSTLCTALNKMTVSFALQAKSTLFKLYLCWLKLISCPKVLLQSSQANGLFPLCDLRAWTSSPCGVLNIFSHLMHEYTSPIGPMMPGRINSGWWW